ncbi:hypothetical protein BC940DRAFT_308916 [Gongronella butleri]|nr:hypothetical protein BC940DRAFT_308916 [Gongronella butleri]
MPLPRFALLRTHIHMVTRVQRPAVQPKLLFFKGQPLRTLTTTLPCRSQPLDSKENMEAAMNEVEDLFGVAKDEMEYAEESHGSVYYQEDYDGAKQAVQDCLDAYDGFLKDLPSDELRNEVQAKVGMKIKELKMAFDALPLDDH